jgi:hypothetical protein
LKPPVLTFAATIRTLGLVMSTYLLVVISSAATHEVKWVQTLIWLFSMTTDSSPMSWQTECGT